MKYISNKITDEQYTSKTIKQINLQTGFYLKIIASSLAGTPQSVNAIVVNRNGETWRCDPQLAYVLMCASQ